MTSAVTLSDGTNTVTFTNNNIKVVAKGSNPIIIIPTPITDTVNVGDNVIAVNLGFVRTGFDLTFWLTDGPGTFNYNTPSTDFEKIMYMFGKTTLIKTLTLNGTAFHGHIENVNIPWEPGKKDLTTNGSMSFTLAKDLTA